ncbi:hypothetical protein [Actinomadura macrotermitis]|nr:hypothetical protein [Actinomadura macrotermitis]
MIILLLVGALCLIAPIAGAIQACYYVAKEGTNMLPPLIARVVAGSSSVPWASG